MFNAVASSHCDRFVSTAGEGEPSWALSVRHENHRALQRRRLLARCGLLEDARSVDLHFRGQQRLLETLSVATDAELERMADVPVALFHVPVRTEPMDVACLQLIEARDELDIGSTQEVFMALLSRLDALRVDAVRARVCFDLGPAEARWLSGFTPAQLELLARDPQLRLQPAVSMDYFAIALEGDCDAARLRVLGAAARGR